MAGSTGEPVERRMSFRAAVTQIVIADVSMSLDNVLAVAGAAKGEPLVLIIGLAVAVVLMAVAANFIADLLARYPWITWIGSSSSCGWPSTWCSTVRARSPAPPGRACGARLI